MLLYSYLWGREWGRTLNTINECIEIWKDERVSMYDEEIGKVDF